MEHGLKKEGLLAFVKELDGNDEEAYDNYLRDASMYARGKNNFNFTVTLDKKSCYSISSCYIKRSGSACKKIYAGCTCPWND